MIMDNPVQYGIVGGYEEFLCFIRSNKERNITWFFGDQVISNNGQIKEKFEGGVIASKLTLSNITMYNSGNYSCVMMMKKSNVSATGNLTIARPIQSYTIHNFEVGDEGNVTCIQPAVSTKEVYWNSKQTLLGSEVISSEEIDGLQWETHLYTLATFTLAMNNSNLTCVSLFDDDVVGFSENIIYVAEAVTLTILNAGTKVQGVGSDLKLTCVSNVEIQHSALSWYLNETEVNVTESGWQYDTWNTEGITVSRLWMKELQVVDSGSVSCQFQDRDTVVVSNEVPVVVKDFKNRVLEVNVTSRVPFTLVCYSYNDDITINTEGFTERVYFDQASYDQGAGWSKVEISGAVRSSGTVNCISEYNDVTVSNYTYVITTSDLEQTKISPEGGYSMMPRGESFNLTCTIRSTHTLELVWRINRRVAKDDQSISTFSNGTQTSVLSVEKISYTKSFDCYAAVDAKPTLSTVNVVVFNPDYFTVRQDAHVAVDTNVTVLCYTAAGSTDIYFTKDGAPVELEYTRGGDRTLYGFTLNSYEVNIEVSDLSIAGEYSCYSKQQGYIIYNVTGQLDVYEPPVLVIEGAEDNLLVVGSGSAVNYNFTMSSSKDVSKNTRIGLKKDNKYIKYIYDHDYNVSTSVISVDFTFSRLNYWYTGVYSADLYIDRQLVNTNTAELQVITSRTQSVSDSAALGDTVSLECYTLNLTGASVKYYFNNTELSNTALTLEDMGEDVRSGIVWSNIRWNITNIQQKDSGTWQCKGFYKEQEFSSSELVLKVLVHSQTVTKLVKEVGVDEVEIPCLWLASRGSGDHRYFINDTEYEGGKKSRRGERFTASGIDYIWVYWVLGTMDFPMIGKYQCQSWYSGEMATNITTFLLGYELNVPEGVLADTAEVNVTCVYDGPIVDRMVWASNGAEMTGLANWTSQHRHIRTDTLTLTGLSVDTVKSMVSCQYINNAYALDVQKNFMVAYAVTEEFPDVTMYTGETTNLTCGYQGRDEAEIDWYYERYSGYYTLLTEKNNNKYQQLSAFSNETYHAKYIWKTSMNYAGMGFKCVIDFGQYKLEKTTRISRKEFSLAPLATTVVAPSDYKITCAWGSSDKPANVTWFIDGNERMFAIEKTTTRGYVMTSVWSVTVDTTNYNTSFECVFMDKSGTRASSLTRVYGATVEIPQGDDFAPSPTNNKVECNYQSILPADRLDWVLNEQIVNDTESQHVFNKDNTHISLTAVSIEPENDGVYYCRATVSGNQLYDKIEITHSEVAIAGASVRYAVGVETEVLECSAASRSYVYYIWWLVNGVRSSTRYNKQDDTRYVNYEKNSTLTAKPYIDAAYKSTGILTYTCYAMTKYGSFQDTVEIHVRASEVKPSNYIALSSTWELTCSIITDVKPTALYWVKDGLELHKNDAFSLQSGTDVKFEFKQDGNSFILNATDSSAADSGTYTCKFEYDDGPGTTAFSNVTVRTVTSSVPRLYYRTEGQVELDCSLESSTSPLSVAWYRYRSSVKDSVATAVTTTEGNITKTTLTFPDAGVANFGYYTCRFIFEDNSNPELVTNLQFADLSMKSPSTLYLQSGATLTLTATYYSSVLTNLKLMWYRGDKVILPSDGYTIWSKYLSWHKYDYYLRKADIKSSMAGVYSVQFITGDALHLNSTGVTVGVIGASGGTETIYITGGPQTIDCKYEGSIVPSSVQWFYNGENINEDIWTIKTSAYTEGVLETNISAGSLTYSDSGDYTCSFQAGENSVTSETELKVRTIETSSVGTLYVTGDTMNINVTVQSTDRPYMIRAYIGDFRVHLTIKTVRVSSTSVRYESSYSYTWRKAGSYDGDYVYKVSYRTGSELVSQPVTVIVRKAYTTERSVIRKLSTPSNKVMFLKTCIYNGVDMPTEVQWYLDGVLVEMDGLHTVTNKATENQRVSAQLSVYREIESSLQVKEATWQDGGMYTCKFTSEDGHDPTVALPDTTIIENSGMDECYTSLNGSYTSTCLYHSKTAMKSAKWTRYRADIAGASSTEYSDNAISVVLDLADKTYQDSGKYYCKAETEDGYSVETVTALVFVKLTMRVQGGNDGKYYIGSKVLIYCTADRFLSSQQISKDGVATGRSNYYRFYVSDKTAGNYTCKGVLKNSCENKEVIGSTAEGATAIEISPAMPSIIKNPSDISTESGSTVTFTCVTEYISGISTKIRWNAENPYKYSYTKRAIVSSSRGTITSLFTLKKVQPSYAGEYYCSVYYGDTVIKSNNATLSIAAFVTQPTDTIAISGGDTQFSCVYNGQDQVILEMLKDGTATTMEMSYSETDASGDSQSTGVLKLSAVTKDDAGTYTCRVKGYGMTSEEAELQLIEFGQQPQSTLGVVKGNAQFNAYVTYYKWPGDGMTVLWQKEVDGAWVNATENWYVVRNPSWTRRDGGVWWKLQLDIRRLKEADLTNWRVKVVYPDTDTLKGASQTSDTARLIPAGLTNLTVHSEDKFVGTVVTVRCEATATKNPVRFSWYFGESSISQRITYTVEEGENTFTAVGTFKMTKFYSGKTLTCKATVNYVRLSRTITLYDAYISCATLTVPNGVIEYTELSETQKQANLTCTGENIYPKEPDKTVVICDYTTGEWNATLTTCNKQIKKDKKQWRIMVYYNGFNYCNNDAERKYVYKDLGAKKIKDDTCGFASKDLNVLCYWAGTCEFQPEKTECYQKNGDLYLFGYFYWLGDVDETPGSDFMLAKADVASKRLKSKNFQCTTEWGENEYEELYESRRKRSLRSILLRPEDPPELNGYLEPALREATSEATPSSPTTSTTDQTTETKATTDQTTETKATTSSAQTSSSTNKVQSSTEPDYSVQSVDSDNEEQYGPDAESAQINGLIWDQTPNTLSEQLQKPNTLSEQLQKPNTLSEQLQKPNTPGEQKPQYSENNVLISEPTIILESDTEVRVESDTQSTESENIMNDALIVPNDVHYTRPSKSISESPTSTIELADDKVDYRAHDHRAEARLRFSQESHSDIMLHRLLLSGVILVAVLGVICVVKMCGCRLLRWKDDRGDYQRVLVISE